MNIGYLIIETRESAVSVETCPMFADSEVVTEIYGQVETVVDCEHGSYTDTATIAAENVGDSESCPTPDSSSTFDPDFNDPDGYGDILTSTTTYSGPVTRADVLGDLPAASFGEWTGGEVEEGAFSVVTWEQLHGHMGDINEPVGAGTSKFVGAVEYGAGMGSISASRADAEVRFSLGVPLACTVYYQIGEWYFPFEGEPDEGYTWGEETSIVVSLTPQTVAIPVEEDYTKTMRIKRIVWHPWT